MTSLGPIVNVYVCNPPSIHIEAGFTVKHSRKLIITLRANGAVVIERSSLSNNWTPELVDNAVESFCRWMHGHSEFRFLDKISADRQMHGMYAFRMLKHVHTAIGKEVYARKY